MNKILRNPAYMIIAAGIAAMMFSISYYALSSLPGTRNQACVDGAYFTAPNIVYSVVFSIMVGLLVSGFIEIMSQKSAESKTKLMSLSGVGMFLGLMTTFCTICTLSLVIPFAAGFLALFTTYNVVFKIIGMASLVYAMYVLSKQLNNDCGCELVKDEEY